MPGDYMDLSTLNVYMFENLFICLFHLKFYQLSLLHRSYDTSNFYKQQMTILCLLRAIRVYYVPSEMSVSSPPLLLLDISARSTEELLTRSDTATAGMVSSESEGAASEELSV